MSELPQRRTAAHFPPIERSNTPVIIFLTICTQARKAILARPDVHDLLVEVWREATHWRVGRYVLMPDHLHLFCAPGQAEIPSLGKWIQFWKSCASRKWPRPNEHPVWQKSHWDTQLRSGDGYDEKWAYVQQNPVRKGLVSRPDDWPFLGEVYALDWH